MRRLTAAAFAALALLTSHAAMAENTSVTAAGHFGSNALSQGKLTASLAVIDRAAAEPKSIVAAMLYCGEDGSVLDFSATVAETKPLIGAIYQAAVDLTLDIPETVPGRSARLIALDAKTLEPITVENDRLEAAPDLTPTYTGIYERLYTLDSADGSIAIDGNAVTVADTGSPFRLKDMGEGWVGFADANAQSRRLNNNGGSVNRRLYGFGGTSMLWRLTAHSGGYYIESHEGGYLAVVDGQVVISDAPTVFSLNFVGETPFTLMTGTEGFKLLSEERRQRVIEICTSVGAGVFPNGTNSSTILERLETKFVGIYGDSSLTPEQQTQAILDAVSTPPAYSGAGITDELTDVKINSLPGGNAEISQSGPNKETLDIWDIGIKEYNRLDVTYTGSGFVQTVKFYYDETGETNVQTAIKALSRFPYEYRQYIKQVNVYVPSEEDFSYNCDGPVLTVRVNNGVNVEAMARGFAHELGHSIDMAGGGNYQDKATHWCQTDEWQRAFADDMVIVSDYGNMFYDDPNDVENYGKRNYYEELAEFARLYFQCCGNRDREIGLKQLFPNQYKSFGRLLERSGMEHFF